MNLIDEVNIIVFEIQTIFSIPEYILSYVYALYTDSVQVPPPIHRNLESSINLMI